MTTCRVFFYTQKKPREFQGMGNWVKPQRSEAWNFHLSRKVGTQLRWWNVHAYTTTTTHMQSLHFAACSFKPFASLDSICVYTVLSLCFVKSQKYIVRITFRSTKREQTAETGSRYFHWNTSKLSPFNRKPLFDPIQSPIYIFGEILVSRRVFDDCLCYISVGVDWSHLTFSKLSLGLGTSLVSG